ncbi:hypothetical protein [Kitasatospora sp. NPDC017646]|uniref:hypothetical protein n=1 Tax=Kitasatospora sp. NPDC017646 TaxID=3364024 RepID=UPI0037990443
MRRMLRRSGAAASLRAVPARFEHLVCNAADRAAGYTVNGGVLTELVLIVWGLISVGSSTLAKAGMCRYTVAVPAALGGPDFNLLGIVNIWSWASDWNAGH